MSTFFFFFLVVTETMVGLLTLLPILEPAYDLSYRKILKQRLIQFFVCQSLQNCRLRNRRSFNHVLKQFNQLFSMVVAKYAFGSFNCIRGCPNLRLMAACVFKQFTDRNGTVSSSSFFSITGSILQSKQSSAVTHEQIVDAELTNRGALYLSCVGK